ncbi:MULTISPECIES: alpha/beta fold hydrolase [Rhodococcus]|uniref:Alpha/beta hydrolase n=1 Tax=Rhodococcus qingshengii TaxID=334542 RepID=A0A2A5IWA7_RHOSG|nr:MULTISPECIES: alpha/beta hydrolase [Rhodococcus]MDJ0105200.1 alpha/beta hydrolase [Rhodococcus erythropolis]MDV8015338.1 alpha/beta hydrolase [Rhodococcus sp. IEGM 1241]PCK21396.1 alpha/beta hydrolase [Rhodococcus qingshengii]
MLVTVRPETGLTLDAEVTGAGEPLLLLQGMSAHRGMWGDEFISRLESQFTVAVYDHRGIGESSRAQEPFTVTDLADDAKALMDNLGWESAHVVGTSMGGMVAQQLCLRAPERVRSVIFGCTTAGGPTGLEGPGAPRLVEAIASRNAEVAVRTAFEVNVSAEFAERPLEYERFAKASAARRVPSAVVQLQAAACLGHNVIDQLESITSRAAVIHGAEDEMILPSEGRKLAERISGASHQEWAGVGHLFWWERPAETAAFITAHAKA